MDIRLDNDGGEDAVFTVRGSGSEACNIRENGNLQCVGTKSAVVETANHGVRQLYAVESPEVWFEDFGADSLVSGEATITIAAAQPEAQMPEAAPAPPRADVSGGGYRLTSTWTRPGLPTPEVSFLAGGGSYRLLAPSGSTLRGSGCCCTYLPCVLHNFYK